MSIDSILFIGFGVFLVLLFVVIYLKDVESNRKFERFARAIEDANRQNHRLHQALAKKKEEDKMMIDEFRLEMHKKVQDEISSTVYPLLESLKDIEQIISNFKTDQQDRISELEERTKSINALSKNSTTSHEKQIIQAYNEGKQVHDIAKDLRIGIGEIEFVLKMNGYYDR